MSWESLFAALLAASVFRPVFVIAAALIVLWLFRVRHPASQHAVWSAVLIGFLAVPIVSVFGPRVDLPVLTADRSGVRLPEAAPVSSSNEPFELHPLLLLKRREEAVDPAITNVGRGSNMQSAEVAPPVWWLPRAGSLVLYGYLAGFLIMLLYHLAGWIMLRRVLSRSKQLPVPPLRESDDVLVPVAVGLFRPIVIVPGDWRRWPVAKRRAVLAHEFTHIRRKDVWIAGVGRLVRCLLWFHPLAWFTARKVSQLAEMSCDARVVERLRDPAGYSRLLVEFAGRVNRVGHRVTLPGLAMVGSGLGHRIDQVFAISTRDVKRLSRLGIVLALIGVPAVFLSATLGLTEPLPSAGASRGQYFS